MNLKQRELKIKPGIKYPASRDPKEDRRASARRVRIKLNYNIINIESYYIWFVCLNVHVGVSNKIVSQVKLVSELFGRDLTLVTKVYSGFGLHAFLNVPVNFPLH